MIRSNKRYNILNICMALLFLQMLIFPKMYMWTKIFFLSIILYLCLHIYGMRLKLSKGQILIITYVAWNVVEIIMGGVRGYGSVAVRMATIDVLWPLAYIIIASKGLKQNHLKWIYKILIICVIWFNIYDSILLICAICGNQYILKFLALFNSGIPFAYVSNGATAFRVDHIYYYAFFTPFMMALLFEGKNNTEKASGISFKIIMVTALTSCFLAAAAGMGGIILACFVGFILCLKLYHLFSKKNMFLFLVFLMFCLAIVFLISYDRMGMAYYIWEDIISRFGVDSSVVTLTNGDKRINQIRAMLKLWMESPLIGNGTGVPVKYFWGTDELFTANNEMSYFRILYQKGIIGLCLFFSLVIYCIKMIKIKEIKWFMKPFMIGTLSFLSANAFNPYLTNLSNYWILFLPFCIVIEQPIRSFGKIDIEACYAEEELCKK